jgi:protein phosphatase
MSFAPTVQDVETASLSDVGRVRRENQDACAEIRADSGARLLVVADGMGGHQGGSMASRLAVEALGESFRRGGRSGASLLEMAVTDANERVHSAASRDASLHGMGTTVVLVLLEGGLDSAWIAHVGDSRIYRLREGRFERMTQDHSAVAELVRRGDITEAEAESHPRKNEILRSLGVEAAVEPTVAQIDLRPGDQLLLCSDGLSGVLSDEEIASVLRRTPPSQAVRTLVDSVNARGAPDNVTVMIAALPGAAAPAVTVPSFQPQPQLPPASYDGPSDSVRRAAAAAAALAALLVALLVALLLLNDWGGESGAPELATPVDADPDVAAPVGQDRRDEKTSR